MKENAYVNIICRGFCSFYKEGKEEIQCGGYQFLKTQLTLSELHLLAEQIDKPIDISRQIPPENDALSALVCRQCDFLIDGCDYSENRSGPPCGGYIMISRLIQ
jgi:hypothetical protein